MTKVVSIALVLSRLPSTTQNAGCVLMWFDFQDKLLGIDLHSDWAVKGRRERYNFSGFISYSQNTVVNADHLDADLPNGS